MTTWLEKTEYLPHLNLKNYRVSDKIPACHDS